MGSDSGRAANGCCARQVLAQRPAMLFLGGPPEDVRFALDRHNATLAGAVRTETTQASGSPPAVPASAPDVWCCQSAAHRGKQLSQLGTARQPDIGLQQRARIHRMLIQKFASHTDLFEWCR